MQGSSGVRGGGQGGSTELNGNFKGDMQVVLGYPWCEERGRLGVGPRSRVMPPQGQSSQGKRVVRVGKVRVGRGGQGGSTELSGNFKGDMQGVVGYPQCEERGRLGVGPMSMVMPPQGPKSRPSPPGEGVRMGRR